MGSGSSQALIHSPLCSALSVAGGCGQVNASFVCWQVWLNLLVVCALWAVQLWLSGSGGVHPSPLPSPLLLSPITRALADHSLLFFLLSNLCTGAVNVTVDTLRSSSWQALLLLLVYIHTVTLCITAYACSADSAHTAQRHSPAKQRLNTSSATPPLTALH